MDGEEMEGRGVFKEEEGRENLREGCDFGLQMRKREFRKCITLGNGLAVETAEIEK